MKNIRLRYKGQAMVEFALVLPMLLLILVGLLEASRLVFIYSSVVTASREAARYGSAYGINAAHFPVYQDCLGIKETAKKFGFLSAIQDDDILIEYDHGPTTGVFDTCNGDSSGRDAGVDLDTGDRIIVTVAVSYNPMTPIVPISAMPLSSTGGRTIMGIIIIE